MSDHIDGAARRRIESTCAQNGVSIPAAIAQLGLASDSSVVKAYCESIELKSVSGADMPDAAPELPGLNPYFMKQKCVLAIGRDDNFLSLAMVDPLDQEAAAGVAFATGLEAVPVVISLTDWRAAFDRLYGSAQLRGETPFDGEKGVRAGWTDDATRLKDMASEAPVIRRVQQLLTEAVDMGASDIHVEPAPNETRIRLRVDGAMQMPRRETPDLAGQIVSRIKVMSDMDVADSRRPQDGRTSIAIRGRPIDLRVSTVPTAYGESLAIRLLDRTAALLDLDNLGLSAHDLELVTGILKRPKGIFLVTGPTGSGKTTTLYAALNRLRKTQRKILTVEDPIEYFFDDINQVQVNEAAGVSFASALRSFLRQDPDIMMVGEIRDGETARIAVQAALTGHLVLSTLHTNDAVSAIARLKDMGVEDYLIAATLSGVTAQRLVRKLCDKCAKPVTGKGAKHFLAKGCGACGGTGQNGRIVISEGFRCNAEISELIRQGAGVGAIRKQAAQQGMKGLLQDGLDKAAHGLVALDDVYAAVGES